MEALWPSSQGITTSSGSGAGSLHDDQLGFNDIWSSHVPEEDDAFVTDMALVTSYSSSELKSGERFNVKVPPAFNGVEPWYVYEELVRDWCDITSIEKDKQGPLLRQRLTGEALVYKPQIDKEKLKNANEVSGIPQGVKYFLDFLRPKHLKNPAAFFLYRLVQYMRVHRGRMEIGRWCTRFDVLRMRLHEAWMDTHVPFEPAHGTSLKRD